MRIITLFTLFVLLCSNLQAQNQHAQIYDSLDVQFFPTGILHERSDYYGHSLLAAYTANPLNFDGLSPSPECKLDAWKQMNQDLHTAALGDSVTLSEDSLTKLIVTQRQQADVPIGLTNLFFHSLSPGAIDSLYLIFDTVNNVLKHVPDTLWLDKAAGAINTILILIAFQGWPLKGTSFLRPVL